MRQVICNLLCVVAMLVAAGCDGPSSSEGSGKPVVFVSIPPQAYLVERVGGEHVEVEVLVGPDESPHNYDPTPRIVADLARASIYFRIGMPFEDRLSRRMAETEEDLEIVDLRRNVAMRPNDPAGQGEGDGSHDHDDHAGHDHAGHDHAGCAHCGHAHAHGELDPHVWMDPKRAKTMARTICQELSQLVPDQAATFEANLQSLLADLDEVDRQVADLLEPYRGRSFYVFHPAFGYFADSYGLKQVAVETGGKEPAPRHVQRLIDRARAEGVKVIFVQPQFATTAARTLAEAIDGAVVPIDPLARDYLANLRKVGDQLDRALAGGS